MAESVTEQDIRDFRGGGFSEGEIADFVAANSPPAPDGTAPVVDAASPLVDNDNIPASPLPIDTRTRERPEVPFNPLTAYFETPVSWPVLKTPGATSEAVGTAPVIDEATQKSIDKKDFIAGGFSLEEVADFFNETVPPPFDEAPMWNFARDTFDAVMREMSGEVDPETGERPGAAELLSRGITQGYQQSVSGLFLRGDVPDPVDRDDTAFTQQIAAAVASLGGDLPFMLLGFVVGGGTAIVLGQAGPQAVTPEEIVTVPALAMGTAFALPAALRSSLMDAYEHGEYTNFGDFFSRQAGIFLDTARAAATGYTTGAVGAVAQPGVKRLLSEIVAMTTIGRAVEGEVPSAKDFALTAVTLSAFKGVIATPKLILATQKKLQNIYRKTGAAPGRVLADAEANPTILAEILSDQVDIPTAYGGGPKTPTKTPGNVSEPAKTAVGDAASVDVPTTPAAKAAAPVPTSKRAADFKESGHYDVTLSNGSLVQIFRDTEQFSRPVWHRVGDKDNVAGIGFTKREALDSLEARLPKAAVPPAAAEGVRPTPEGVRPTPEGVRPTSEAEAAAQRVNNRIARDAQGKTSALTWDNLYTHMIDRFHPIRRAVDAMIDGKKLSAANDPYVQARLSVAAASKGNLFLEFETRSFLTGEVTGPGLKQVLAPVATDLTGFGNYAVARRVIDLTGRDIQTGINRADAELVVAAGNSKYAKVFPELEAYQERMLTYVADAGLVSPKVVAAMREANKDYVPFFREMEEGSATAGAGSGVRIPNPIKGIKGSERKIIDPLESIIKNTYAYVQMADRNRTLVKLADLIDRSPNGEMFGRRVETPIAPTKLVGAEIDGILRQYGRDAGVNLAKEDFTIFRALQTEPSSNQVTFLRNGVRQTYELTETLAQGVKNLDESAVGFVVKVMAVPASTLRAGAILDPAFVVRNAIRDNATAAVFSNSGFVPFASFISGFGSLISQGKPYKDWLYGGGAQATFVSLDRRYLRDNLKELSRTGYLSKAPNVIKEPLGYLRVISELAENSSRLGEFKRAQARSLRAGEGPKGAMQAAAFESREVTLDFARRGQSMKALNMISAFTNARVQGYDRLVRAFKDNPGRATAKAGMYITAPSVLLWLANHDDPRYQALPDYVKNLNWIILTDDNIFRIPKPHELGIVFGTLPELMLEAAFKLGAGEETNLANEMLAALSTPVASSLVPNAMTPIIEEYTNHSIFRKTPLIPSRLEGMLPEDQYTEYTTETVKTLARLIAKAPGFEFSRKASPAVIDNYIRQWTGGLGVAAMGLVDTMLKEAGVLPTPFERPEQGLEDIPFIKSFVVRYPSMGTQDLTDFYADYEKLSKVAGSVALAVGTGDIERFKELGIRNPTDTLGQLSGIRRTISDQSKMVRQIYSAPGLDPAEKRDLIDNLYHSINSQAQYGNKMILAFEKAVEAYQADQ